MLRSRSQEQQKGFGIMDVPAVEENSPFDRNQLILIFVFISIVVLYLLFRFGGMERKVIDFSKQPTKNTNNYTTDCYNVVGYKGDKGAYERRRCWYRQLQTQLEFPPSLLLDEYPNFKEYQAKMGKILMVPSPPLLPSLILLIFR